MRHGTLSGAPRPPEAHYLEGNAEDNASGTSSSKDGALRERIIPQPDEDASLLKLVETNFQFSQNLPRQTQDS